MTAIPNLYLKWRAFRELADVNDPDNWIGKELFKTEDGAQRFSKLLRGDLGCSPAIAGRHVETVLTDGLARANLKREDISAWIFHAGGREILSAICQHVELAEEDVRWSAEVLHDYGNVSSPCVYFVLQLALRDRAPKRRRKLQRCRRRFYPPISNCRFSRS